MTLHQIRTHPQFVENCFGCKASTIDLWGCTPTRSVGAGKQNRDADKAWTKELDLYASTRKEGIQPAGTTTSKIRQAVDISNKVGRGYDASTGGFF